MSDASWVPASSGFQDDNIGSLLAFFLAGVCAYAAILLLQRAHSRASVGWGSLSVLALSCAIAGPHFVGLPLTAAASLDAGTLLSTLICCAAIGGLALHYASRPQPSGSAHAFYAVLMGLGLCMLADRGIAGIGSAAAPQVSYDLGHVVLALMVSMIGSSISLSILHGLRTMPERSILPPRPLAGLSIGAALMLTQSMVFHAARLPQIAVPQSIPATWIAVAVASIVLATMTVLIQFARSDEEADTANSELATPSPITAQTLPSVAIADTTAHARGDTAVTRYPSHR